MIPFILYLFLLLSLIYVNGFFHLFKDKTISKKTFAALFLLKTLAIPVFYYVYQHMYGGIEKFDSGKFYNDASVISHIANTDLPSYLQLLLGFQNDTPGTYDFLLVQNTLNWDNGEIKDFLYNDNRVLIRLHSLIHFISFDSIFVHALFSCFISFIGIYFLYKTVAEYFEGKEIWVLLILCLFPALWFYTGALLKEGLTLCVLGCTLYQIKQIILFKQYGKRIIVLMISLWICLLLKPYLLFFAVLCFSIFFLLQHSKKIQHKVLGFVVIMSAFVILLNTASVLLKHRSLMEAALVHQRIFAGVAKGGIFLFDDTKFIRLPYDSTFIKQVPGTVPLYSIQKNASYMYWMNGNSKDTLFCDSNKDTLQVYQLAYKLPVNHSNLAPVIYSGSAGQMLLNCFYYSLAYPFFFNAHNALQYLASLENLVICISLTMIALGMIRRKKEAFLPFCFLFFALSICLLIGIATPNSGAIFRYRSPVMIFILLAALYYFEAGKLKLFNRNT